MELAIVSTRWLRGYLFIGCLLSGCSFIACDRKEEQGSADTRPASSSPAAPAPSAPPYDTPRLLFLPDAGDIAPPEAPFPELVAPGSTALRPSSSGRCPPDMVEIDRSFCIDRFESSLVDSAENRSVSPYYHPEYGHVVHNHRLWSARSARSATALGRTLEVPAPPDWELAGRFDVRAVSEQGVVPNGYLNQTVAARACGNAGKRLCSHEEWMVACRGERQSKFPYGESYEAGLCNVDREAHPANLLHGNASINHLDPRLNLTTANGRPLLRRTGETSTCRSAWGNDAVYDMVGNLDEWVDEADGMFAGGFYSRGTKQGCDAAISSHPPEYFDYSLGTRCCRGRL